MKEPTPTSLGRYAIQEEIGRGMMGVVYRAVDPELHRTVALKTVRLAWAISDEDRELFEKRFLNEARVAAGLSHPGIVVVHDVGRDAPSSILYIALEYLEGRTLAEATSDGKPMGWRQACELTVKLAEALHHAHEKGIVHRDIKPANIMVLPSGDPKVMDFGIAKLPTSQLTAAGEFFGTPSYMSPEQAGGAVVDGRSDLFSLGAVLYLLLTGRRAFDAPSVTAILTRVALSDPAPPSQIVPGLPPVADYILARALAKKPAARYPNGRALAEDLSDMLEGRPPRHRPGWREPAHAEETFAADLVPLPPETEDLRRSPAARTLDGHAPTLRSAGERRVLLIGSGAALALLALLFYSSQRTPAVPEGAPSAPQPAQQGPESPGTPDPSPDGTERLALGKLWPPRLFEKPAKLAMRFEHTLKRGRLRVYVDDELVAQRDLEAPITKKIVIYKKRREVIEETLDVAAGERMVKLVVVSGDDVYSSRIKGRFQENETRRLRASLGGILGKELQLGWLASAGAAGE